MRWTQDKIALLTSNQLLTTFQSKTETYNDCTILGSYCGNSGLLVSVPERKSDKDTGIRRMSYNGIVTITLTNR